ncbi:MAG: DUF6155 family protein [Methanosarcinales archaeon]
MKLKEIKEHLSVLPRHELEKMIVELYKKNQESRELIELKFNPASEIDAFEKYKKQIIYEFFPDRGFGKLRYSVMRKALKNFTDLSKNHELIADLMMTHVESGVKFTNEYGDINERFYDNIAGMYMKVLRYITKHDLKADFKMRCKAVVMDTKGIGWGFHDELDDLYSEYYGE